MMKNGCIVAVDQGTTGTTALLIDREGRIVGRSYREITQNYPRPGWVEHDPHEIWRSVRESVGELMDRFSRPVEALGIANQRETTVVWDRETGRPAYNAIVWQCRRTAPFCERLKSREALFRKKTGLPVDPYFSGTKIRWILENVEVKDSGRLVFGTIDSWLIWNLTGGEMHATDFTNASRTLLFDIQRLRWDPELCDILGIPSGMLPEVKRSCDDYGRVKTLPGLEGVPVAGAAGDQQAALFGQTCFSPGEVKNTYGTGCFLLMSTGGRAVSSSRGLLTTLAADGRGHPCFALEGSIFIGGAALQWLRDEMGILNNTADSEEAARSVPDNGGVYLVPAFVGLGAPHWNMSARGLITGLTRGANRNHVIRAALESMAYQTQDVLGLMEEESGIPITNLSVDGGAAANDFLLQFQSDILDRPVIRPETVESTSLGAAFLAGLGVGFWKDAHALAGIRRIDREFRPGMDPEDRRALLGGWRAALRQALCA